MIERREARYGRLCSAPERAGEYHPVRRRDAPPDRRRRRRRRPALPVPAQNRGSASPETLRAELKWDEARRSRAEAALARMGLVSAPKPEEPTPSPVPAPTAERPAYSREDVARKLEQDASFSALLREVERKLGRSLRRPSASSSGFMRTSACPPTCSFSSSTTASPATPRSTARDGSPPCAGSSRRAMSGRARACSRPQAPTTTSTRSTRASRSTPPTWQSFSSANASPPRARRNTSPPGWTWASPPRPSPSRMIRPSCAATNSNGRTATAS